jgi:hypothetical protein
MVEKTIGISGIVHCGSYYLYVYPLIVNLANIISLAEHKNYIIRITSNLFVVIYFVVYILYYHCQIYDIKMRASRMNWNAGSTKQ